MTFTINKEYSKSTKASRKLKKTTTPKQLEKLSCGISVVKFGQVSHPMQFSYFMNRQLCAELIIH